MQLRGHDTSNLRAGVIIVLLILGAVAIGVGSVGDAVAIDQPRHLAKAAKKKQLSKAKAGRAWPKSLRHQRQPSRAKDAPGKGAPAGKNDSLGKDALSKHALSRGHAGQGTALGKNAPQQGSGSARTLLGKRPRWSSATGSGSIIAERS